MPCNTGLMIETSRRPSLPHVALSLRVRVDVTPMVDLGVGFRVMLHERPIRTSRLAFHFRNTRALRLVIRSRSIPRRSYWLVICRRVSRKRRFLRSSVFVVGSPISIRYSGVAGDVAIARVVVVMLVFGSQGAGTNDTEFGVLHAFVLGFGVLALPEALLAVAGGVVVGGAGTVAFFALVGAGEEDFQSSADEEEEAGGRVSLCLIPGLMGMCLRGNDGDDKGHSL